MKFNFTQQIKEKTSEELTEIFINAKEYNPDFVRLAELELNSRNINLDISKRIKEDNKQIMNEQLTEGKPGSPLYILFCFILALFGGLIAIYAGYVYRKSKTKNNEGQEFYVYNEQTRELGEIMMWLGVAVFLFFLLRQIFFR